MELASRYAEAVAGARRYVVEWARKRREANEAWERWIVKMYQEGASLRAIAEAGETTHATVDRILRKAGAK